MYSAPFDTNRACTGILSLPASLRDNERRYIDHKPEHSAETEESGLSRVVSQSVVDLKLPTRPYKPYRVKYSLQDGRVSYLKKKKWLLIIIFNYYYWWFFTWLPNPNKDK